MTGKHIAAVLALLPLLAAPAVAQDTKLGSETQPVFVAVEGLAPADLLNIRATASPTGLLLDRVQNGTLLKSFGCTPVNGYDWCRIEGVEDADVKGWTPARYLIATGTAPEPAPAAEAPGAIAPDAAPLDAVAARPRGPTNLDLALAEAAKAGGERIAALSAGRPPERPQATIAAAAPTAAVASSTTPQPSASESATAQRSAPADQESGGVTAEPQPARAEQPAEQAAVIEAPHAQAAIFSPAILVLFGFPTIFMIAMASIASFGSFTFAPDERAEAMA